jgi:hypothetical protein
MREYTLQNLAIEFAGLPGKRAYLPGSSDLTVSNDGMSLCFSWAIEMGTIDGEAKSTMKLIVESNPQWRGDLIAEINQVFQAAIQQYGPEEAIRTIVNIT